MATIKKISKAMSNVEIMLSFAKLSSIGAFLAYYVLG